MKKIRKSKNQTKKQPIMSQQKKTVKQDPQDPDMMEKEADHSKEGGAASNPGPSSGNNEKMGSSISLTPSDIAIGNQMVEETLDRVVCDIYEQMQGWSRWAAQESNDNEETRIGTFHQKVERQLEGFFALRRMFAEHREETSEDSLTKPGSPCSEEAFPNAIVKSPANSEAAVDPDWPAEKQGKDHVVESENNDSASSSPCHEDASSTTREAAEESDGEEETCSAAFHQGETPRDNLAKPGSPCPEEASPTALIKSPTNADWPAEEQGKDHVVESESTDRISGSPCHEDASHFGLSSRKNEKLVSSISQISSVMSKTANIVDSETLDLHFCKINEHLAAMTREAAEESDGEEEISSAAFHQGETSKDNLVKPGSPCPEEASPTAFVKSPANSEAAVDADQPAEEQCKGHVVELESSDQTSDSLCHEDASYFGLSSRENEKMVSSNSQISSVVSETASSETLDRDFCRINEEMPATSRGAAEESDGDEEYSAAYHQAETSKDNLTKPGSQCPEEASPTAFVQSPANIETAVNAPSQEGKRYGCKAVLTDNIQTSSTSDKTPEKFKSRDENKILRIMRHCFGSLSRHEIHPAKEEESSPGISEQDRNPEGQDAVAAISAQLTSQRKIFRTIIKKCFDSLIEKQHMQISKGIYNTDVKDLLANMLAELLRVITETILDFLSQATNQLAPSRVTNRGQTSSQACGVSQPLMENFVITEEKLQQCIKNSLDEAFCEVVGAKKTVTSEFMEVVVTVITDEVSSILSETIQASLSNGSSNVGCATCCNFSICKACKKMSVNRAIKSFTTKLKAVTTLKKSHHERKDDKLPEVQETIPLWRRVFKRQQIRIRRVHPVSDEEMDETVRDKPSSGQELSSSSQVIFIPLELVDYEEDEIDTSEDTGNTPPSHSMSQFPTADKGNIGMEEGVMDSSDTDANRTQAKKTERIISFFRKDEKKKDQKAPAQDQDVKTKKPSLLRRILRLGHSDSSSSQHE